MKKKQVQTPKLQLNRRTLLELDPGELELAQGAGPGGSTGSGCGNRPTLC